MTESVGRSARVPELCLTAFAVSWIALAIQPWDRAAWWLENVLTAVVVPVSIVTFRRFRFSDRAYVQATAFMLLHTVGSHYTYSRMPVGDWIRDVLDHSRNHYDRVVHFAFGLLMLAVTRELFFRPPAQLPLRRQLALSVGFIVAMGAAYEVLEWWTAIVVDPTAGIAFLGTQGDEWDAQKDMLCVAIGALLAAAIEARLLTPPTDVSPHSEQPQ